MRRRSAFTITELLVAMALIVFIMSIIATAFSEGIRVFRALKGIGDMNRRMRMAATLLQDDLQSKHFGGDRRLSDTNFWTIGPPPEGFFRIWQGSVLSATFGAPYYSEGMDLDYNLPSVRAVDHIMHFTVRKQGNDPKDFFHAAVPFNSWLVTPPFGNPNSRYQDPPGANYAEITSQWAEVAWFMRANGQNANGTPLFTLYRRQRLVVPNAANGQETTLNFSSPTPKVRAANYNKHLGAATSTTIDNYLNVSCRIKGAEVYFNTPSDLTVPQYRFSMQAGVNGGLPATTDPITGSSTYYIFQPIGTGDPLQEQTQPSVQGADAVITDVVSFAVRISTGGAFKDVPPSVYTPNSSKHNSLFANPTGPFVFDTWTTVTDDQVDYSLWNYDYNNTSTTLPHLNAGPPDLRAKRPPLKSVITAIQIQLRIWDSKTEQTRQMTLVVDM